MVSKRKLLRVIIESIGETIIIYAGFRLTILGISLINFLLVLVGVLLRIYADDFTITLKKGNFIKRLSRFN